MKSATEGINYQGQTKVKMTEICARVWEMCFDHKDWIFECFFGSHFNRAGRTIWLKKTVAVSWGQAVIQQQAGDIVERQLDSYCFCLNNSFVYTMLSL